MKRAALLALFFCAATPAFADGMWELQVSGISYHPGHRGEYNENNAGLGIQYTELDGRDVTRYTGGFLQNSMDDRTWYAGAARAWRFGDRAYLDVGFFAGVLTYPSGNADVYPAVLPVVTLGYQPVSVNITYLPELGDKTDAAILFQLSIALPK